MDGEWETRKFNPDELVRCFSEFHKSNYVILICCGIKHSLFEWIVHLNDDHSLSFRQIAYKLERLETDMVDGKMSGT